MSQTASQKENDETLISVKLGTLKKIKGDKDKADSLVAAAEIRFISYENALVVKDARFVKLQEQVDLKIKNEALCTENFDILYKQRSDLEKLNKKLNFRVKLYRNVSIGLAGVGAGAFVYYKYIR